MQQGSGSPHICLRVGEALRRENVAGPLRSIGVPEDVLADIPELAPDLAGLLVYGSRARGDATPESDLDLLALVAQSRPSANSGAVSVSYYTLEQLSTGIGTLFGAHLKRDSRILFDQDGLLGASIDRMGVVDTERVLSRSRLMAQLFTTSHIDLPQYLPGLLRQARYLLRSCLYALAIQSGDPCFSVRALASRHHDPTLVGLLGSRQTREPSAEEYAECIKRLELLLGKFPSSLHGSLEATVVIEWGRSTDLLSMAYMALGRSGGDTDYAEVEKILL